MLVYKKGTCAVKPTLLCFYVTFIQTIINGLTIVTFNCHSFETFVHGILLFCEHYDVIIMQEVRLSSEDVILLQ